MWRIAFLVGAFTLLPGLDSQTILEVDVGESKAFRLSATSSKIQECNITVPTGDVYELLPNTSLIETINGRYSFSGEGDSICGVTIDLTVFADSGAYMLSILEGNRSITQANYTLRVRSRTTIWPTSSLMIYEGNAAYLYLPDVPDMVLYCYVTPPEQAEIIIAEGTSASGNINQWSRSSSSWCGVAIEAVDGASHSGYWKLIASTNSTHFYYNKVHLVVLESSALTVAPTTAELIVGQSYHGTFGHENASYCVLLNPQGSSSGITSGQCTLELNFPTSQHIGTWVATAGVSGSIDEISQDINIEVKERQYIQTMSSSNSVDSTAIDIYCKTDDLIVEICRFVSPNGTGIAVTSGVGNGEYRGYQDDQYSCGLTIVTPNSDDYGTWKCLVGNASDLRAGYISVSEFLRRDSRATSISESYTAYAVNKGNLTLSCNADSSLLYCWFKHPNGSYYAAIPGEEVENNLWSYSGDGLSVGSCAITFRGVSYEDSGEWTCNMGISNQLMDLSVSITAQVTANYLVAISTEYGDHNVTVACAVQNDLNALSYCRFVKPDGIGINAAYAASTTKYR
ncbi:uncharacterized protein LOC107268145 [Cephus cinctus]|uniref:Uncharacterized protein LOC107268145 n=1 Tax=Cephus cinctus TaxID=211228 RepID=A0AAJ7RHX9_CEPCN|nr:uncharacterized protein LOC107268145 [Cephus cinctus]